MHALRRDRGKISGKGEKARTSRGEIERERESIPPGSGRPGAPGDGYRGADAYEAAWPLAPGHRERNDLYQLYHVLNHLNLFGSGYLGRAQDLMQRLLRG